MQIYVGTYAKYNAGNLFGKWLEPDDYLDKEDFLAACAELHKDESDPEYMYQDHEGCLGWVSESSVDEELWDYIDLPSHDQEVVAAYRDNVGADESIEKILESLIGRAETEADWAEEYLEDVGLLSEVPESLRHYIDFEAYARDARLGGDISFAQTGGGLFVFHNS